MGVDPANPDSNREGLVQPTYSNAPSAFDNIDGSIELRDPANPDSNRAGLVQPAKLNALRF